MSRKIFGAAFGTMIVLTVVLGVFNLILSTSTPDPVDIAVDEALGT